MIPAAASAMPYGTPEVGLCNLAIQFLLVSQLGKLARRPNRSANVRIPTYTTKDPKSKRVEFRTPDSSCNAYLAESAILAAGLDGIVKKLDCGDPVDGNIYDLSPEKRRELGIKQLPGSLVEATDSMLSDSEYLRPIFPKEVLDDIVERELRDHRAISIRPHPYEFYLYFDA